MFCFCFLLLKALVSAPLCVERTERNNPEPNARMLRRESEPAHSSLEVRLEVFIWPLLFPCPLATGALESGLEPRPSSGLLKCKFTPCSPYTSGLTAFIGVFLSAEGAGSQGAAYSVPYKDSETLERRGPPVRGPPGIPDFTGCVYRMPVAGAGHYDSPRSLTGVQGETKQRNDRQRSR